MLVLFAIREYLFNCLFNLSRRLLLVAEIRSRVDFLSHVNIVMPPWLSDFDE